MKRKSSHDSLTGKELAEIILRLLEDFKDLEQYQMYYLLGKIEATCQDVVDEW